MAERIKNLEKSWEKRSTDAKEKVLKCVQRMQAEKVPINFNSVHIQSGLSKTYLYNEPELRRCIEVCRQQESHAKRIWHEKYDKTSKSKDVVIEAKSKCIAKLEEENSRLRSEVKQLRGLLYDKM